MRIGTEWQRGGPSDHCLAELYKALVTFHQEIDGKPQTMNGLVVRFSESMGDAQDDHRLSLLMEMLEDTQMRLQRRMSDLTERVEVQDAARKANQCYGGVVHREQAPLPPSPFRYSS